MPFSEAVKDKVKEMSNFQCCKCQAMFVDVHHIIPESDGGSDDVDNAVPLCPNCHRWFGGNPELRKAIKSMRDFHYENCKKQKIDKELLKKIDDKMVEIQASQKEILDKQENKFEKIASNVASLTRVVADRFDEIVQRARNGEYPNPIAFSNDIISASGTASTVFGTIGEQQYTTFGIAGIGSNAGKFVRCPCGNFIEVKDFGGVGFNHVTCSRCKRIISF